MAYIATTSSPYPLFPKEFFSKDDRLFFKRDRVLPETRSCFKKTPPCFRNIPTSQKKAKKYSYFFANSSNVLPSNWQIAFL